MHQLEQQKPRLSMSHFAEELMTFIFTRARASQIVAGVNGQTKIVVRGKRDIEFTGTTDQAFKAFLEWLVIQPGLSDDEKEHVENAANSIVEEEHKYDQELIDALASAGMTPVGKAVQEMRDERRYKILSAIDDQRKNGFVFTDINGLLEDIGSRSGLLDVEPNEILTALDHRHSLTVSVPVLTSE